MGECKDREKGWSVKVEGEDKGKGVKVVDRGE